MKTAIKKRLVFYWFLLTEWIKRIRSLNQLGPNEDTVRLHHQILDRDVIMAKKSQFIKKDQQAKEAPIATDTIVVDDKQVDDARSNEILSNFNSIKHNIHPVFSESYLVQNLELMHELLDQKLRCLSTFVSFLVAPNVKIHLKTSTVVYNGIFTSQSREELISSLFTALYEELYIKAEQVNKIPKEFANATPALVIKPYSDVLESVILNKITDVWYYYDDVGVINLVHKLNQNITVYCSEPITVLYSGLLYSFIHEIYNPIAPRIVYGSYFEIIPNNKLWKIYKNEPN